VSSDNGRLVGNQRGFPPGDHAHVSFTSTNSDAEGRPVSQASL